MASATQHTVYRSLRAFLNFTVAEGWLDRSPLARIKPPKVEKKLPRVLTPEQARALVKAAPTERERALVLLILDTGLRVSEVCALNGGDVSLVTGAVYVRHGKGGKDRLTFCGAKTRRQLHRYFSERGRPGDDEPLFVSEKGKHRLTRAGIDGAFRRTAKLANVPDATPHTLRRTYATNMLRAGCDLHTLARLMGHEDLTTLRAYVHLLDTDLKAASQRFGIVDNLL
jgi:integrase/recombinase XerD